MRSRKKMGSVSFVILSLPVKAVLEGEPYVEWPGQSPPLPHTHSVSEF